MKKPEYIEGEHALKNFQNGMRVLFQASKQGMQKKAAPKKAASKRKRSAHGSGKA